MTAEKFPLTCPRCGQTAMSLRHRLSRYELISSRNIELPDGSPAVARSRVECGACHAPLSYLEVSRAARQAGAIHE